eukprot:jgi/Botrbrau1/1459/Bobra.178_3s0017.1
MWGSPHNRAVFLHRLRGREWSSMTGFCRHWTEWIAKSRPGWWVALHAPPYSSYKEPLLGERLFPAKSTSPYGMRREWTWSSRAMCMHTSVLTLSTISGETPAGLCIW